MPSSCSLSSTLLNYINTLIGTPLAIGNGSTNESGLYTDVVADFTEIGASQSKTLGPTILTVIEHRDTLGPSIPTVIDPSSSIIDYLKAIIDGFLGLPIIQGDVFSNNLCRTTCTTSCANDFLWSQLATLTALQERFRCLSICLNNGGFICNGNLLPKILLILTNSGIATAVSPATTLIAQLTAQITIVLNSTSSPADVIAALKAINAILASIDVTFCRVKTLADTLSCVILPELLATIQLIVCLSSSTLPTLSCENLALVTPKVLNLVNDLTVLDKNLASIIKSNFSSCDCLTPVLLLIDNVNYDVQSLLNVLLQVFPSTCILTT